jgi:hypothetical protein
MTDAVILKKAFTAFIGQIFLYVMELATLPINYVFN